MRFSSDMLPFEGSLFLERQPICTSFQVCWERDQLIFLLESRNSKISGKQQNLPEQPNLSSNEIPTEKSLGYFPEKEVHIGCLSRKRLPLKGSILLENLIGPSFLALPV